MKSAISCNTDGERLKKTFYAAHIPCGPKRPFLKDLGLQPLKSPHHKLIKATFFNIKFECLRTYCAVDTLCRSKRPS